MNYYLLFKSLHLISIISWMAGLLYLPRLFVYHAETKNNVEKKETFQFAWKWLLSLTNTPSTLMRKVALLAAGLFDYWAPVGCATGK